jgi:hypothetical protein
MARTVVYKGIKCVLVVKPYDHIHVTGEYATLRMPLDQFSNLSDWPELPHGPHIDSIELVNQDEIPVVTGFHLTDVRRQLQQHESDAEAARYLCQISALQRQCAQLQILNGKNVTKLQTYIRSARQAVSTYRNIYSRVSLEDVQQYIRQAEREAVGLDGNPIQILLKDLMTGRVQHPDIVYNNKVIQELEALAIRSGGFIECPTPDQLRKYYESQLNDAASVLDFWSYDFKIKLEDYAPSDVVAELELAPDSCELEGRKGKVSYTITYGYETLFETKGCDRIAVASVTVPLAVYERNCAEHGRKSSFPELPEGITLLITVAVDDKPIARGEDGEKLQSQIRKFRRSERRSRNTPDLGTRLAAQAWG